MQENAVASSALAVMMSSRRILSDTTSVAVMGDCYGPDRSPASLTVGRIEGIVAQEKPWLGEGGCLSKFEEMTGSGLSRLRKNDGEKFTGGFPYTRPSICFF